MSYYGENLDLLSARSSEMRQQQDGVKPTRMVTAVAADPEQIDDNYYEPSEGLSVFNTDSGLATHFKLDNHSRLQNWVGVIANEDNNSIGGPQTKVSSIVTTGQVIYRNTSCFEHSLYEKIAVITPDFIANFGSDNKDLYKQFKNLYADIYKHSDKLPALTIPARFLFSEGGLAEAALPHLGNSTNSGIVWDDTSTQKINNLKIGNTKVAPSYSDAIRAFISGTRELARISANKKTVDFADYHNKTQTEPVFEQFMNTLKKNAQFAEALKVVTTATIAYYSSVPKFLCVSKAKPGRNGTCQY